MEIFISLESWFFSLIAQYVCLQFQSFASLVVWFYVDNVSIRCPQITFSCRTRVSENVWGMLNSLIVTITWRWPFYWKMNLNVLLPGCLDHVEGGRFCILLLWSWTFSHWHSSIYCRKFLHIWPVSPNDAAVCNISYESSNWNHLTNSYVDNSVKRALPEKYREKTQASLLTAVVSAAAATLTCYPLDTVRRQMQMRGTPYKSVLEAIPGMSQCYSTYIAMTLITKSI